MGYGGPVWHASARHHGRLVLPWTEVLDRVMRMLHGVGDHALGEWIEEGNEGVVHVRRRLAEHELNGLVVRDIRGTDEARTRYAALPRQVRDVIPDFVRIEELGL